MKQCKDDNCKCPFVTIGWDFYPTTVLSIGGVLPRNAENIINEKYYKNGTYPTCPKTGQRLKAKTY